MAKWSNYRIPGQFKTLTLTLILCGQVFYNCTGEVNTQNVRQYARKGHPPTFNFERSNSREHLTVWAALCGNGMIFGPYFFERNVNGISYLRMFNEFVFLQLVEHFNNQHWEGRFRGLWWAQDGAPAHRLITVRDRLNDVFGNNCIIGLGHDVEWPPRSPDIHHATFFCGGTLKIRYFQLLRAILTTYARKSSANSTLYEIGQPSFHGQCVICIMLFVAREGGHVEGHGA